MALQHKITLNGVAPDDRAILDFSVAIEPLGFEEAAAPGTGANYWRRVWAKDLIRISASGWVPPDFPAVDFGSPVTLVIKTLDSVDANGDSTWSDQTYTVHARPPVVTWNHSEARHDWTLEAVETTATDLLSRDATLSLGGVAAPAQSLFTLSRSLEADGGYTTVRKQSGALIVRSHYSKRRIDISASGWSVPDFSSLSLPASGLALVVAGESYTVLAEPLRSDFDAANGLYTWSLACRES